MEYIDRLNNKNLKKLLAKRYFSPETINELKTCFLIHPCTEQEDGMLSFNYVDYENGEILEFFTSMEEYNKSYKDYDFTPAYWELKQLRDLFYQNTLGIIINPESDNVFIPTSICDHIITDAYDLDKDIFFNRKVRSVDDLKELSEKKSDLLVDYLKNKTKITYLKLLFDVLNHSIAYTLIASPVSLDEYFEDGVLPYKNVKFAYFKKNDYIMVFCDKKDFKDVMNKDEFYYYRIANMIDIMDVVFKLDYEGIILKNGDVEIELSRKRLLRHFHELYRNYIGVQNASDFAFKIEGD